MNEEMMKKMRELVDRLNDASNAYYNGLGEVMSDYEWDALFDELKKLEHETGTVLEDSPTINVSSDTTVGEKEAHEFLALSLAKTKKVDDLVKWAEGRKIWISWKLDGLTLVVSYDNGRLAKVVTRGDGHIGTNITHLAGAIDGIPKTISYQGHLVVRGEAVISYEDFNTFIMENNEDYANPRNLASGSLNLKDVEEVAKRKIRWIAFTLVHADEEIISWGERMDFLKKNGLYTVESEEINDPTYENIEASIAGFTETVTSGKNPYPVDGLVICYDDTEYASTGSVTGHHATRAGYAFKWADEAAETVLDHIEWSCAASTITPVAVFEPVQLEGTTVKRASLCNISECERLKIGTKGTKISVIKANKIIPKVIAVNETVGKLNVPSYCPVCGSEANVNESTISGTKTLKCSNPLCSAKQLKKFERFVSKHGMDIEGISVQTITRFNNEGWIRNNADIYRLIEHAEEIAELDGFGEKSVMNLEKALTKSKEVEDRKLIYALNIPIVGQDVAKKLLAAHPFHELISIARESEDEEVFAAIDGIGSEKSAAFVRWFHDETNVKDLEDLLGMITVKETSVAPVGKKCEGLTFVVTGDVFHYKNRNELKAYIEAEGGKVTGSVSKSTHYLINNDLESTSSKNVKAKSLGIPIISEDEFIDLFHQNNQQLFSKSQAKNETNSKTSSKDDCQNDESPVYEYKGIEIKELGSDYVLFDLETTGVPANKENITEIGALRIRNGVIVDSFETLVNPEKEIQLRVTHLTGITNEMVKEAPTIQEVLPKFIEFIGTDILVGHKIKGFDLILLEKVSSGLIKNDYFDTLNYANKVLPEYKNNNSVEKLLVRFGLGKEMHRALSDCKDEFEILKRLIEIEKSKANQ